MIDDNDGKQEKEKEAFALTTASELLIKGTDHPCISPVVELVTDSTISVWFHHLNKWFYDENRPLSEITLGKPFWEFLVKNPTHMSLFNEAMASDSQMMKLALKDHNMAFQGLESIVDVGGGTGTTAQIISENFPKLKFIVFDLPHIVKGLKASNNLSFVGGDMFESIPKAHPVLLSTHLFSLHFSRIIMAMETAMNPTVSIKLVMPLILLHQNLKIQRVNEGQIAPKDASVPPSSLISESRYLLKMKTSIAESKGNDFVPDDTVKVAEPNIPKGQIVETVESVALPETKPATVAY
ncbi:hypothetical protein PIB30_049586 [Stylosanthes scabra]|uniref:O-methyltransferase C-terminal domain-containing protein n=1 Tax=Stylosanthes scabra TaxID=79078 RepID=A0ABU6UJK8_9FABA|nr:hypothetical protein [Stylosanthes scabra]